MGGGLLLLRPNAACCGLLYVKAAVVIPISNFVNCNDSNYDNNKIAHTSLMAHLHFILALFSFKKFVGCF